MIFAKAPNAPELGCSFRRWTDKMCFVFGSSAWTSPGRPRDISAIAILEVSTTALFHRVLPCLALLPLAPLLRFSPFGLCLTTQNNAAENKAQQETRERKWTRGKIAQKNCQSVLLYLAAPRPLWSSMAQWSPSKIAGGGKVAAVPLGLLCSWRGTESPLRWSKWVKFVGHSRDFGDMSVNFSDKRRFLWHLQNG